MSKVAKLVSVSLITRVIVDENATEEQILNEAKDSFLDKIYRELGEHVEDIADDTECPYDKEFDTNA